IARLGEADIARYLESRLARGIPSGELIDFVDHYSQGNALFMVAIVNDLIERGLLDERATGWYLAAGDRGLPAEVPRTLQQLLQLQLNQATALEQSILSAASVAGMRFSAWELTAATQSAFAVIEETCESLAERRRFIRFVGMDELANGIVSAHFEFVHALYREFLYAGISPVSRSRLHRAIAEQLETLGPWQSPDLPRTL